MLNRTNLVILFTILFASVSSGQNIHALNLNRNIEIDSVYFTQLKTDSLFNSKQIISILAFNKRAFHKYRLEYAYSNTEFHTTSEFAKQNNAYAAINAGFFDMTKGGSVAYFEINDSVISYTHPSESRWAKPPSIINGAIIITESDEVIIDSAKSDKFYEASKKELSVLLTGPLLLFNSQKVKLPDLDFAKRRHPRTFFCTTDKYIVMITIDGRSENADGLNLFEAQDFLLNIGCNYAINLDGGGSTTMWIKGKGVVNFPSDKNGERPVANVILIMKNENQ
jgi:exopolysaccharide biosynthesis protein